MSTPLDPPDYWTQREKWPFAQSKYVFVPDAFDRIGREMFGSEWLGIEGSFIPCGDPPPRAHEVFEQLTPLDVYPIIYRIKDTALYNKNEARIAKLAQLSSMQRLHINFDDWALGYYNWVKANDLEPFLRERRRAVFAAMHRALADELIFAKLHDVRQGREGQMSNVEAHFWNCNYDVVAPRLARCSMNCLEKWRMAPPPSDPHLRADYERGFNLPIFLVGKELDAAIPVIGRRHRGEPEPMPPTEQAPAERLTESIKSQTNVENEGAASIPFIPTGAQGRASGAAAIMTLLEERAADGRTASRIGDEAAALAEAYRTDKRYRVELGWPRMTKGTIENRIRARYWEIKPAMK